MALRIFNLHGLKFGTSPALGSPTQIVGPMTAGLDTGQEPIYAEGDGLIGPAAIMKAAWGAGWTMDCQDVSGFMTQLAAWEAATGMVRAIQFEGREDGALTVMQSLIKRAVLTGASLSCMKDQVARVNYSGRVRAADASTKEGDEIAFTGGATKTATIGTTKRAYRAHTVTHAAVSIPTIVGVDVNVQGIVGITSGDNDFGEVVTVDGFKVSGKVTIQDHTIATAETLAQRLIAAARGALVIKLRQQDGATDTTLTLALAQFFRISKRWQSHGFANVDVTYACEGVSGSTVYGLATGANKIITMA